MNPDNRDWGRGSPLDYVPFVGVFYRCYWCFLARRGTRHGEGNSASDWHVALRSELSRLFLTSVISFAAIVFLILGGTEGGAEPAVVVVVAGFFVHRVVSLAAAAGT